MKKNNIAFCLTGLSVIIFLFLTNCTKKVAEPDRQVAISSIHPTSAGYGDTVTLYGKNLSLDTSAIKISINNKQLDLIMVSDDSIKFIIPQSTSSGQVILSINGLSYDGPQFSYEPKVIVTTIAGTGQIGTTDGAGSQASFYCPWGITADTNGDLYIADTYNRLIRKITAADNNVSTIQLGSLNFYSPYNITLDKQSHSLYATDFNEHLMKIAPDGNLSVIYMDSMPLTGIAVGPDRNLYISNNNYGTIIKVDTNGQNRTIFASGLVTPRNIIFDASGAMYVAAYSGSLSSAVIDKIDNSGNISVVNQDKQFQGWEIALDTAGNFYEADHFSNVIKRIDKNGNVVIIAGNGIAADVDGIGVLASFDGPQGITIDSKGNLYVTTYNYDNNTGNKVRKISFQ
jgi:streptogramin lyase